MPRFHFEIVDGYTIEDPVGLDCNSPQQAQTVADEIARQIAIDLGNAARTVLVVDDDGVEVYKTRVGTD